MKIQECIFLLLVTCAVAFSSESVSCKVRLINELSSSSSLTVTGPSNATVIFAAVPFGSVTSYSDIPCGTVDLTFTNDQGAIISTIPLVVFEKGSKTTFFAAGGDGDDPIVRVVSDATDLTPDGINTLSVAQIRVCNALRGEPKIYIMGSSAECYGCSRPPMYEDNIYGQCSPYRTIDTTWGSNLGYADSFGEQASSIPIFFLPLEHGSYTIIVKNVPWNTDSTKVLNVIVDVEGRNAYLPIAYAFLIILGLFVLHYIATFLAVRYMAAGSRSKEIAAAAKKREEGKGASRHDLTLSIFFGFDAALVKYLEKEKVDEEEEEGGKSLNSGGSLSERLIDSNNDEGGATTLPIVKPVITRPKSSGRIVSIDAFRGIALSIMIFVNYGGGGYDAFFDHSKWNGLTVADLVFPWFTFLQGCSMAISFESERKKNSSQLQLATKTFIRAAKLFSIGLFLNNGVDLQEWRIPGVLQYFAMSYLVVGLLETFLHPSQLYESYNEDKEKKSRKVETLMDALEVDIKPYLAQWLVMIILAVVYFCLQSFLVLDEGCPAGYIGAGGLADNGKYSGLGCTGGAHRKLDGLIFGFHHVYHYNNANGIPMSSATCDDVYHCDVHDPEGFLGSLSAMWMCWLGLQAGRVLVNYKHLGNGPKGIKATHRPFLNRWLTWSAILCLLGGILCGFKKEGGLIPVNKNLWSPSMVLVLAGFAFFNLSFFYTIVDVYKLWSGAPFMFMGSNSILIYFGSESFDSNLPFKVFLGGGPTNHAEQLASNVIGVISWIAVARYAYLKEWFLVI